MSPSDILYEMDEIKKEWRENTFQVTPEVQRRYIELKRLRRARLAELKEQGRVVESGVIQS